MTSALPIAVLLLPSVRSLAYIHAFRSRDAHPAEIVLLEGALPDCFDALVREGERHGYGSQFDLGVDIEDYVSTCGAELRRLSTADINATQTVEAVAGLKSEVVIYTGAGFARALLETGKRLLHMHPGWLPRHAGSTCFTYSLLEDFSLAATAFFLGPKLDAGPIVARSRFSLNVRIEPDQPLFLDHVLDPAVRAAALGGVLDKLARGEPLEEQPAVPPQRAYYVMHSLLRHLTIERINREFDSARPAGVHPIEE